MAADSPRHGREFDRQRQFDLGHPDCPALRGGHPIGVDSCVGKREGSRLHERMDEIGRLGNDCAVDAPGVFHFLITAHHGCRNTHLVALIAGNLISGIGKFHLQRNPVDFHLIDFRNTASVVVHFAAHGIKSHLGEWVGHRRRGSGRHSVHIPDAAGFLVVFDDSLERDLLLHIHLHFGIRHGERNDGRRHRFRLVIAATSEHGEDSGQQHPQRFFQYMFHSR